MKYLFFDIECSNCLGGIGKICEFGYVLTDENFKILRKDEITMSPGKGRNNRFNLTGRKDHKDLVLSFDEEYYFEQQEFPYFYDQIKGLMEQDDVICFAWASDNDIIHLYHACLRYKKPEYKYVCYDVQKMAQRYLNEKDQMSLKSACMRIVGPDTTMRMQEHLSSDDALMTMKIFEAIAFMDRVGAAELLSQSEYARDDSIEFTTKFAEKKKQREEQRKRNNIYKKAADSDADKLELPEYKGKRYCFSGGTKRKADSIESLISAVKSRGGILTANLEFTDVFVCSDDTNMSELKDRFAEKYSGEYITIADLLKQE